MDSLPNRAAELLSSTGSSAQCSGTTWRAGMSGVGGRFKREGIICIHIADSLPGTAESNTTL